MIPYCILAIEDESDRAFMTELYENYHRLMYSEIYKVLHDPWDTDDILQVVLEKLIDKIPLLRSRNRNQLVNYIISACKYKAYNHLRSQARSKSVPFEDYLDTPDTEYGGHQLELHIIREEELNSLARIWPLLDIRTQCLLNGYYILEKSMDELGRELGIRPGSVRMALSRARKKAFDLLKEEQPQP